MQAVSSNATLLGVLYSVVAPAVLTNACSVLVLGTSNRLARVVDRTRVVGAQVGTLPHDSPDRTVWHAQLAPLNERAKLLLRALSLFYSAIGLLAFTALLSVGGSDE